MFETTTTTTSSVDETNSEASTGLPRQVVSAHMKYPWQEPWTNPSAMTAAERYFLASMQPDVF